MAAQLRQHDSRSRRLAQRVVPNESAQVLDAPDCIIGRFTDDGQHLLCFRRESLCAPVTHASLTRLHAPSRGLQEVVVHRFDGLAVSQRGEAADAAAGAPARALRFATLLPHLYSATLAAGQATLCRDFCLFFHGGAFAVLASSAPGGCGAE